MSATIIKNQFQGFLEFVRQQGVVGLAVGFILGGAVSKVVSSLVQDVINPLIGIVIGRGETLAAMKWTLGAVEVKWGSFMAVFVDFLVIALVVYYGVKIIGLDRLDKKKS
ncbi:MAG: MscL family protein [Candidatus Andersenbacteria bacterium]|nr:MscL family protein [Candidatus Andersenbacteria bacterium]